MNIKILVCCHKEDIYLSIPPYVPIHVGKEKSSIELGIPEDNTGENINTKNNNYCELTGMSYGAREIARSKDNKKELSQLFGEIDFLVFLSTIACAFVWSIWIVLTPEYNLLYLIWTLTLINTIADISWFFMGLYQFKHIIICNSTVKIVGLILLFIFIRNRSDLALYIPLMTLNTLMAQILTRAALNNVMGARMELQ